MHRLPENRYRCLALTRVARKDEMTRELEQKVQTCVCRGRGVKQHVELVEY